MRAHVRPISFAAARASSTHPYVTPTMQAIELIRPSERHCETQVAVRGEGIGRCRVARVVPVEAEVKVLPHLTFDGGIDLQPLATPGAEARVVLDTRIDVGPGMRVCVVTTT
jgi:hypothetical protein